MPFGSSATETLPEVAQDWKLNLFMETVAPSVGRFRDSQFLFYLSPELGLENRRTLLGSYSCLFPRGLFCLLQEFQIVEHLTHNQGSIGQHFDLVVDYYIWGMKANEFS